VNVGPDSSFQVQLTVNAANRALGQLPYRGENGLPELRGERSALPAGCQGFSYRIDSRQRREARRFEIIPESPPAVPAAAPRQAAQPMPYIPSEEQRPPANRVFLLVAAALLATGLIGAVFALRALTVGRKAPIVSGELSAESERHQLRR